MPTDYYELLGVSRDATQDEIKRAYRRLARQLHPDTGHGDAESEARFKEVVRAYEVLSDPEKRQRYDAYGPAGVEGPTVGADPFGFGGGIGDVFEAFFGSSPFGGRRRGPTGPPRGEDLEQVVELEFEEAVFGSQHPVTVKTAVPCDACEATGAADGTQPVTCHECGGTGQVQRVRQSFIGQMVTSSPCARCGGSGQIIPNPCPVCRGEGRRIQERTYTVDIVAGVDDGSTLRLAGRGAVGPSGWRRRRPVRARAGETPSPLRAPRHRPGNRADPALHAGGARGDDHVRDARGHRGAGDPPGHGVGHHVPRCGAGAFPTSSGGRGATC